MSSPGWTRTTVVLPSGCRMTIWLPICRIARRPNASKARSTLRGGNGVSRDRRQTLTVWTPTNVMPFGTNRRGPMYASMASRMRSRSWLSHFACVWQPGSSATQPTYQPSSSRSTITWNERRASATSSECGRLSLPGRTVDSDLGLCFENVDEELPVESTYRRGLLTEHTYRLRHCRPMTWLGTRSCTRADRGRFRGRVVRTCTPQVGARGGCLGEYVYILNTHTISTHGPDHHGDG